MRSNVSSMQKEAKQANTVTCPLCFFLRLDQEAEGCAAGVSRRRCAGEIQSRGGMYSFYCLKNRTDLVNSRLNQTELTAPTQHADLYIYNSSTVTWLISVLRCHICSLFLLCDFSPLRSNFKQILALCSDFLQRIF